MRTNLDYIEKARTTEHHEALRQMLPAGDIRTGKQVWRKLRHCEQLAATFDGSSEDEGDRMPTDEQGANARLISAAPDLLEACNRALDAMKAEQMSQAKRGESILVQIGIAIQECRKAIEKAGAK